MYYETYQRAHLNWHKSHAVCLAQIIKGLIAVKTVNLVEIATSFTTNAKIPSSYRRLQRFFKRNFPSELVAHLILTLFPFSGQLLIIMDRTNWKFGKTHLNLLVLSIAYQGIAIPIYWVNLAKAGTSHTNERIYSVTKSIFRLGRHRISGFLADREFIGNEWFTWLKSNNIDFTIRVKQNLLVGKSSHDRNPVPLHSLFRHLKNERRKYLKKKFYLGDVAVYLSASKAPNGKLLIVATPRYHRRALKDYKRRWEIESAPQARKEEGLDAKDQKLCG